MAWGLAAAVVVLVSETGCETRIIYVDDGGLTPGDSGSLDAGGRDGGPDSGDSGFTDAGCAPVGFSYGQEVIVDGVSGKDDTQCACGSPQHPCKSLTYAMSLIAAGPVQNVTLRAQLADGGPEWPEDLEQWPVHLGWGVTLVAPDLYFNAPPNDAGIILFQVNAYDAGDDTTVTIEGDPADVSRMIHIGVPVADVGFSSALYAVVTPWFDAQFNELSGVPLTISNAWFFATGASLYTTDGATVQLGPLPVHFGTNGWKKNLSGGPSGIVTLGSSSNPPLIFDVGYQTVEIDAAEDAIQVLGDSCEILLTHGPRIGSLPQALFDGGCPTFEQHAVSLIDKTHVSLGSVSDPAQLSCQQDIAVFLLADNQTPGQSVTPSFDFVGTMVDQRCFGIAANTGEISLLASSFQNSLGGIWLAGDAHLSLSGSGYPSNDLDICQQPTPASGDCNFLLPFPPDGARLAIEDPRVRLDIENVEWGHWDAALNQPQIWSCTGPDYYSQCT